MADQTHIEWPREIWMAERDEHDQGVVSAVLSEHATIARWEGDKEGDRDFHKYVDADIFESSERYWKERAEKAEAALASQATKDVLTERERQKSVEGWTEEHDDEHSNAEMSAAAAAYAFNAYTTSSFRAYAADPLGFWPWDIEWWKPTTPRRDLIKAAALILAEIDRIDRMEARP